MATLSDDRLVREIKPFLSRAAQNYINMVQRTGKSTSILQQFEGLTTEQIRFLDKLMANPSVLSGMNIINAGITRGTDPGIVAGLNEAVARGGEIPEVKRPYYNPVTSSVEMLTGEEAQRLNYREATQEEITSAGIDRTALAQAEFEVPPTTPEPYTAPAGYEWVYDPLQSKPVLQKIGEDGATTTVDTDGDEGVPSAGSDYVDQTELDAAIPEDWKDAAREAYPAYYAIVKNIPEIAQLLEKAINQGYTDAQFQAELEQTNWWKQTTASAREWDINGERDPATQQTQIDNRTAFIQQTSLDTFGVRIGAETASELALDSLRQSWGQQFLLNSIGDVATQSTAGISQLRAGFIGQDIRQTAYDYGIAISENTFNKFVNEIAVGKETKDTFQQYALTQAKNLFPSVADRLDAGETFQQIVDPYKQNAASLLEIDPESIDFTSPDWAKAITYQDAKGEQRPMNFSEFNDYVRQTRSFGYEYTDQAKNKAYKVASDLANLFGRI